MLRAFIILRTESMHVIRDLDHFALPCTVHIDNKAIRFELNFVYYKRGNLVSKF